MNKGHISDSELTTFFTQVRAIDALKWGFPPKYLRLDIDLFKLTEVLEVSFFTARTTFRELDVDKAGA